MARQAWQRTITDAAGNVLTGVQITVFQADGVTPATIYGQLTGGSALANPFSTGAQTSAKFYADPGRYVVRAFKDGLTQEFTDVDIGGKAVRDDIGSAAYLVATTSETDRTSGRALRVGDHGNGTTFRGRVDVLGGQTPAQIVALHGEGFVYNGAIQNHGGATPEAWGIISGYITSLNAYSYSYQEFTGIYAGKYRRTAQAGGNGWNPWVPVYDGAGVLGTVAFSSGVNTGAVLEYGTNSNGNYLKLADGTMFCWGTPLVIANQLSNNNVGSFGWSYYYENNSVNFPAAFSGNPLVQVTTQGAFLSALVLSTSPTAFVVSPVTTVSITAGAPIMYLAVGRWR